MSFEFSLFRFVKIPKKKKNTGEGESNIYKERNVLLIIFLVNFLLYRYRRSVLVCSHFLGGRAEQTWHEYTTSN